MAFFGDNELYFANLMVYFCFPVHKGACNSECNFSGLTAEWRIERVFRQTPHNRNKTVILVLKERLLRINIAFGEPNVMALFQHVLFTVYLSCIY